MGVNEYLMPECCERLTVIYLQVYGSGPHFVLNALECWVELLHIFTHWELLGMLRDVPCGMCDSQSTF